MQASPSSATPPVSASPRRSGSPPSGSPPSGSPPSDSPPVVAARLRAAGCVFAEDEARLLIEAAGTTAELAVMVERRAAGRPLEHVLGWADFCGLRVAVEPGVFVPRPRTRFLVRSAAALLRPGAVLLDLCCGSGAIGAALSASVAGAIELHAADVDPDAVGCARRNLAPFGGRVYLGDLYAPLPAALRGRVDVLVANVPYVPSGQIRLLPAEARVYEARAALDGGPDGLEVLRRVAAPASSWLAPGGHLLVEAGERQAAQATAILTDRGLTPRVVRCEDLDATVLIATAPGGPGGTGRDAGPATRADTL
jgi:release factor glutamine methyltransferase